MKQGGSFPRKFMPYFRKFFTPSDEKIFSSKWQLGKHAMKRSLIRVSRCLVIEGKLKLTWIPNNAEIPSLCTEGVISEHAQHKWRVEHKCQVIDQVQVVMENINDK